MDGELQDLEASRPEGWTCWYRPDFLLTMPGVRTSIEDAIGIDRAASMHAFRVIRRALYDQERHAQRVLTEAIREGGSDKE